jgi:predicted nucleic acid-binding protein
MAVDSSSLITLAGADAISLLTMSRIRAFTVKEVFRETVEIGLMTARPDAVVIAEAFESGAISVLEPRNKEKLPGISMTDSLVLLLAEDLAGRKLLVNDHALLRKAEARGIAARFTAEFVLDLQRSGEMTRTRRDRLFELFVANGRYTSEFIEALLLRG